MLENLASNIVKMKKKDKTEIVELYYDFQKEFDKVSHAFLEELLYIYGFQRGE